MMTMACHDVHDIPCDLVLSQHTHVFGVRCVCESIYLAPVFNNLSNGASQNPFLNHAPISRAWEHR